MRPRLLHAVVGCALVGLVLGPRWPSAAITAALVAPVLGRRGAERILLATVVVLAAVVGCARMTAVDRTTLHGELGHAVAARVTVLDAPRERRFGVHVALVSLRGERVLLRSAATVRWPTVRVGDLLLARGGLEVLPPRESAMALRGAHAQLRAETIVATADHRRGLVGVIDAIRTRAIEALRADLPPPQAALLRGMVLGDDSRLSDAARGDMRIAGLTHLVAASGANVLLLAGMMLALGSMLGVDRRVRLLLVLGATLLYVPLAGDGPSIQRAGLMGAAGAVAALAGRPADRRHALLLAGVGTVLLQPHAPEQVGWQLSFAAVLGIAILAAPARGALGRRGVPGPPAEALAVTVAATLGTAPLIALHFGQASPVTLPANVLAAPLVAPVMWLGFAAGCLGQIDAGVAAPLAALAGLPVTGVLAIAHAAARWPGAGATAPAAVVALICAAAGVAIAWRTRRGRLVGAGVAACALLAATAGAAVRSRPSPPKGARLTFLDIGQGDATLLQDGVHAVLVDTGPPDGPIVARLRHAGVRRLDALVVTHAQDDHDGGAAAVLGAFPVGLVVDGRDGVRERSGMAMAARARTNAVPVVAGRQGQRLHAGGIGLRVLWPPERAAGAPPANGEDPNQRAIVAVATLGGMRALLTADAESDVLLPLGLGAVDVLKVSHHGSADEGLPELLRTLRPGLAGIEVGAHNTFGHPVPATVEVLRASGARVMRTDRDGSVVVEPVQGGLRVVAHE